MVDTGNVEITKIDKDNKASLAGVVFEIQDETGKVVTKVTTDKEGKAKVSDLSVGNYTLVEVGAPKGYEKLTNPIPFEITKGMINSVQLEVLNELRHLAPPGPEKPDPEKPEKELPKTGQKMPVEPYMGALLVMMSFGLLVLGRKQQR